MSHIGKDIMHMLAVMLMFAGVFSFAFVIALVIAVPSAATEAHLLCILISVFSMLGGMVAVMLNNER
tara:strand:+ start:316 stop:516 length:201 start_codon:yes stop_codon:yes gene_type:complete